MPELENSNLTLLNYMKIFFRRKELIFVPAFLGLAIGISAGIVMPKEFRSTTVILVQEGKTDNPLFENIAVSSSVLERLANIKESMLGWNSLVKLVKRLNLDRDIKTSRQFEGLVLGIRNRLDIRLRSNNIIQLSFIDKDPVQTQAVVQNITDIFIDRNKEIQSKETSDAITFIEQQLKVYKGKIKSAEIAKMQDQLNELLRDSTDRHPLVKELREKIDKEKIELSRENLEYTDSETLKIQSNNSIIDSIKSALDQIESKPATPATNGKPPVSGEDIYKVMLLDKLDDVLARDVKINENIYNILLQRLETAKITQRLQASKEGTRYTIIDPPRVPLTPSKPNKPVVALAGLFGGLMLGLGLVFAGEFLDKSFLDVEEAKEFLGTPLLGAISKIITEDTIQHEREQKRWVYSLTIVGGILLVVSTVAVANIFNL